ncbi:MAG: SpoIIE family protein phosphatase [Turneriella sp.]
MKLRYKLSLTLALLILVGILPVSVYIVNTQEKERIAAAGARGDFQARLFAKNIFNILLMDAGDITAARVDARELSAIYKNLESDGLLRAVAYLSSKDAKRNRAIIAGFDRARNVLPEFFAPGNPGWDSTAFAKLNCTPGGMGENRCMRFEAQTGPAGKPAVLTVELVYSLQEVTAPIYGLRRLLYGSVATVIAIMLIAGFFLSRRITRPLQDLLEGVNSLEHPDKRHTVTVKSDDELGILATSFNRMADTLDRSFAELRQKNEELTRLDKMKDDFLAVTSHELKTPLNGIIGLAGTLLDGAAGPVADTLRKNIETIKHSGQRLASLVDGILDMTEVQNKKIHIEAAPVVLRDLADEVLAVMRPASNLKKLLLLSEIPADLPAVLADKDRLAQILFNLLGNAIKFTDTGSVTLKAAITPQGIRIIVKDTGIGIAAENQSRIFNSFEQLEGANTRRYGGLGLGLTVCRQLVQLHGSKIEVESQPGRGSEFSFVLPAATSQRSMVNSAPSATEYKRPETDITRTSQPIQVPTPKSAEAPARNRRYNILVVDDEPVNLQVLLNQLSLFGYDVNVAESGQQAIDYMEHESPPDAILLDVMMPGMSGYEVSRILRNKFSSFEVPILMLTAKNRNEDVVMGFAAGANDYITKPFESEVLLARVKTAISLKESVREKDMLESLQRELSVAQKIQQALLPVKYPQFDGIKIAARYHPMAEVGGDFYDFVEHADGFGVLIADVSGHGIPAALIASMVKMAFSLNRELAAHPGKMLTALNQVLCEKVDNHFVTASYYFVDFRTREIRHANAGHPPLFLIDRLSKDIGDRKTKGGFLGVFPEIQHIEGTDQLKPGLRLLQVTDGVLESRSRAGTEFGIGKLKEIISQTLALQTEATADMIMKELRTHNPAYFDDDVTFVLIDCD